LFTVTLKEGSSNKEIGRIDESDRKIGLAALTSMKHPLAFSILALSSLALAACATTGHDEQGPISAIKPLAVWAGFATEPEKAADFVQQSRPTGSLDYQPVGVTPADPKKKIKKLTPDELKAMEDDLEATRLKNAAAAGASP